MSETSTRVILIENQFKQYEEISKNLGKGFDIFPPRHQFKDFLDRIRVFLNIRYSDIRRERALQEAISMWGKDRIDIFIIDHILVGNHSAENGIDLAKRLREDYPQPIIFLSRTPQNHIDVCKNLPEITGVVTWVPKGYYGEEIFKKEVFRKQVLEKIPTLIEKTTQASAKEKISSALIETKEILKGNVDMDAKIESPRKKVSIALLEALVAAMETFLSGKKNLPEEFKAGHVELLEMDALVEFGTDEYDLLCKRLTQMLL